MKQNQQFRGIGLVLLVIALITFASSLTSQGSLFSQEMTHQEFMVAVENKTIESVDINQNQQPPTGILDILLKSGDRAVVAVSDVKEAEKLLRENSIDYIVENVPQENYLMSVIIPVALSAVVIMFMFMFMNARLGGGGGGNSKMMNFGKSRAKMSRTNSVNFSKVAGLEEEKEELEEIVDFLKNPKKYTDVRARIPKGVILVGPPGTGKTLLAKAVAGEAGVPFFSISGSDFVEMFVGVGASRVRDLFEDAKKNAPCIVFIDEIDAVARRRGTGMGGGHDEREQTLNQLLVEMDGFGVNEGIIVMAATNRVDILDPAILRPGRFDRKVGVGKPDIRGREEILKVHSKEKPLGDDVDLTRVAQTTAGFTGADLENLLNEAAILAAKQSRRYILQADIDQAFVKVGIGAEKKSKVISEKEKKITAYHETGHAILFHELPDVGPVHTISIIPTGMGAAGYTMPLPEKDEMFNTKNKMLETIMVSLGGRIAEEIIFGDVTTGASQDIKQASAIARAMVTQYGMSEKFGLMGLATQENQYLTGRTVLNCGDATAAEIDVEVMRMLKGAYAEAKRLLSENRDALDKIADFLIEKETITGKEFMKIFRQVKGIPEPEEEIRPEKKRMGGAPVDPAAMERPETPRESSGAAPETDSRTQVPSELEEGESAAETAGNVPEGRKAETGGAENE